MDKELDHYRTLLTDFNNPVYYSILFIIIFLIIIYFIYLQIFKPVKRKHELEKRELVDLLEDEKQRIGMYLHDSIGQNLTLVKLKLNDAAADYSKYLDHYNVISSAVDNTINDLREIMMDLKPRALEDLGLYPAVEALVHNISKNYELNGSINFSGIPKRMDNKTELYLFRIIQESLNNILKHSGAKEFHIQFIFSDELMKISISDNGIGFNTGNILNFKGYGLLNMSERIKNLHGKMKIESSDHEGTLLLFEIPYLN